MLDGFLRTGNPALSCENGSLRIPLTEILVDRDARRAEPAVDEDLGERSAERVADNDRRIVQVAHQCVVVVDDLTDSQVLDRGWISTQRSDVAIHSRPTLGDDAKPFAAVALNPLFPAERGH